MVAHYEFYYRKSNRINLQVFNARIFYCVGTCVPRPSITMHIKSRSDMKHAKNIGNQNNNSFRLSSATLMVGKGIQRGAILWFYLHTLFPSGISIGYAFACYMCWISIFEPCRGRSLLYRKLQKHACTIANKSKALAACILSATVFAYYFRTSREYSQSLFCVDIESRCFCRAQERQNEQQQENTNMKNKKNTNSYLDLTIREIFWDNCMSTGTSTFSIYEFLLVKIYDLTDPKILLQQWCFVFFFFFIERSKTNVWMPIYGYGECDVNYQFFFYLCSPIIQYIQYNISAEGLLEASVKHVTKICYILYTVCVGRCFLFSS